MRRFSILLLAAALTGYGNHPNRTAVITRFSTNKNYGSMEDNFYTHALWHVKEGREAEFIAAWKTFGEALSRVPNSPPVEGTLIQSMDDPLVFYSFGPWESLDDIGAMRKDENVQEAMARIRELCQETKPGNYKKVVRLSFPGRRQ